MHLQAVHDESCQSCTCLLASGENCKPELSPDDAADQSAADLRKPLCAQPTACVSDIMMHYRGMLQHLCEDGGQRGAGHAPPRAKDEGGAQRDVGGADPQRRVQRRFCIPQPPEYPLQQMEATGTTTSLPGGKF